MKRHKKSAHDIEHLVGKVNGLANKIRGQLKGIAKDVPEDGMRMLQDTSNPVITKKIKYYSI